DLKRLNKQFGEAVDEGRKTKLSIRKTSCIEATRRLEVRAKEKYKPRRDGNQPAKRDEHVRITHRTVNMLAHRTKFFRGIEEIMEAALEDIEEKSEEALIEVAKKEPNRRRLMRIQAITKKLLLSADTDDVAELWNDDDELLKDEVDAIVKIVHERRPYVPKGRLSGAIALRVRFVFLSKFAATICPTINPASIHALPLNAASMYDQ
ncbi:hypothetical protein DFQ29_001313, partial [Apophysomyces sp. BC1021]